VGKQEGKRQLGRPKCKWEDNVKMDLEYIVWCGMNWIDLADRELWKAVMNTLMNLCVP
jgi:hypothetical protein